MRKNKLQKGFIQILILITIIGGGLLLTTPVLATSGACSWHGGVNCDSGADWDGSVICNDGWRDSSVSFYSANECIANVKCTLEDWNSLKVKYGLSEIDSAILSIQIEISNTQAQIDAVPETISKDFLMTQSQYERLVAQKQEPLIQHINALSRQLNLKNSERNSALSSMDAECYALGKDRERQEMLDNLEKRRQQVLDNLEKQLQELEKLSCPINSTRIESQCICNNGFAADGDKCTPYTQYCQSKRGLNSYGDSQGCHCSPGYVLNGLETTCNKICPVNSISVGNDCVCNDGYEWNSDKIFCFKSITCSSNSSKINNTCICNDGYIMGNNGCVTYNQNCQNSYGAHSYGDKTHCYCESDYEWNSSQTACIKIPEKKESPPQDKEKPQLQDNIVLDNDGSYTAINEPQKQEGKFIVRFLASISNAFKGFFNRLFR